MFMYQAVSPLSSSKTLEVKYLALVTVRILTAQYQIQTATYLFCIYTTGHGSHSDFRQDYYMGLY